MSIKTDLVAAVRELQEIRDQPISAQSTLLRFKTEELLKTAERLCGDDYFVDDDGKLQRIDHHSTYGCGPTANDAPPAQDAPDSDEDSSATEDLDIGLMDPHTQGIGDSMEDTGDIGDEATEQKTRAAKFPDDAVITITVERIPGRDGSASYERRKLMRSGMTVGEFVAAAGKRGRSSLAKSVRKGWVTVTSP